MNIVKVGNIEIGSRRPRVLIAGSCVIEYAERALKIGRSLKQIDERLSMPYAFRASCDKAKQSSYKSFGGPGLEK